MHARGSAALGKLAAQWKNRQNVYSIITYWCNLRSIKMVNW
jgi:hypothetical protein